MRESKRPRLVVFKLILWSIAIFFVLGAIGAGGLFYYYGHDLPSRLDLTSAYQPPVVSTVYDVQVLLPRRLIAKLSIPLSD